MNIKPSKDRKRGITLIEIVLFLMMLTIATSIVSSIFFSWETSPKSTKRRENVLMIKNAMEFYKLDNGDYPTTAQGIEALVVKPVTPPIPKHWRQYLPTLPHDSSGRPYQYIYPDEIHYGGKP